MGLFCALTAVMMVQTNFANIERQVGSFLVLSYIVSRSCCGLDSHHKTILRGLKCKMHWLVLTCPDR